VLRSASKHWQAGAGLGAGFNLTTTAEGVETAEQFERVHAFGIIGVALAGTA